jgi:hypothetical protein
LKSYGVVGEGRARYSAGMRCVLLVVCLSFIWCAAGCRAPAGPSPSFEAFSRNKLAVLARNIESTRDAQTAAADQVLESIQTIKREAWTGAEPGQAYDQTRRLLAVAESRARNAHARVRVVENNGRDFFLQWSKEASEYQDQDLRESSRQNRLRVKAAFDKAIEAMKAADEATEPPLLAIRDQMLFLKHHRNSERVPPRPQNSADPMIPAETLMKATQRAAGLADAFVGTTRAEPATK